MRRTIQAIRKRVNRKNVTWFARTCGWSWLIQGALYGVLWLSGMGAVSALVSAKGASYAVWFWQLWQQANAE